ncbi:MAG: hypothetical protein GQ553_01870 [Nitrosomonadaceae bacterium]|nr:hypothetical protein [Nitrosomonadaceae bacterium]
MSDYKFELSQIVFVIPVKMRGVIEDRNKPPIGENIYEVGVMYQSRVWKTAFYESELTAIEEKPFRT